VLSRKIDWGDRVSGRVGEAPGFLLPLDFHLLIASDSNLLYESNAWTQRVARSELDRNLHKFGGGPVRRENTSYPISFAKLAATILCSRLGLSTSSSRSQ
jgi:hypothetical protein